MWEVTLTKTIHWGLLWGNKSVSRKIEHQIPFHVRDLQTYGDRNYIAPILEPYTQEDQRFGTTTMNIHAKDSWWRLCGNWTCKWQQWNNFNSCECDKRGQFFRKYLSPWSTLCQLVKHSNFVVSTSNLKTSMNTNYTWKYKNATKMIFFFSIGYWNN